MPERPGRPSRDFVGHIGGDDFLLVLGPQEWRKRLNQLLDDFHTQCRRSTAPSIWTLVALWHCNRQGVRQEFALLSLSIGVVHLYPQACGQLDASQLAELASQAKHHAKDVAGYSIHVIDSMDMLPRRFRPRPTPDTRIRTPAPLRRHARTPRPRHRRVR